MNILLFAGLSDRKLLSKISPLIRLDKVDRVYLARNSELKFEKVTSLRLPRWLKTPVLREFAKLLYGIRLGLSAKIDYVIGIYFIPHGILASLIGRILGKPVIQLFIGDDVDAAVRHKKTSRWLLRNARAIGVRGTRSAERLGRVLGGTPNFFALPNLFTPPEFGVEGNHPPKEIDLINVGYFDDCKRVDIYLEVVARIRRKYPHIRSVFAGKDVGRRRAGFEEMRKRLGLEENVRFPGEVEDVFFYLRRSRVFLMTSESEGIPMAMIEAMSVGLPCVVPDVGDIPDLARDGMNAFVVPPLDVEAFASKAMSLLEDEGLYKEMSRNARQTIRNREKEYTFPHIREIWDKALV